MKIKLLLIGLASLLGSFTQAATISITNFNSPSFSALLSSSGIPTSGIVTLGTYTSEPSSATSVLTGYTSLGTLLFGSENGGPIDGYVQGDINIALPLGNPAVGQQIYVVVGNGSTLANSTEFLVWKPTSNPAGNTYTADNPVGGPDSIQFLGSTGTTIVGDFGFTGDFGSGSQGNFRLAAIPEPSSMLLGAVGALGLLRRRRI